MPNGVNFMAEVLLPPVACFWVVLGLELSTVLALSSH